MSLLLSSYQRLCLFPFFKKKKKKKKKTSHSTRSYTNRTMCKISQGEANAKRVISFVCKDKGFRCCQVSRKCLDTTAHFAINLVFT